MWWESEIKRSGNAGMTSCPAEEVDAEDPPVDVVYSGSTGKTKRVVNASWPVI